MSLELKANSGGWGCDTLVIPQCMAIVMRILDFDGFLGCPIHPNSQTNALTAEISNPNMNWSFAKKQGEGEIQTSFANDGFFVSTWTSDVAAAAVITNRKTSCWLLLDFFKKTQSFELIFLREKIKLLKGLTGWCGCTLLFSCPFVSALSFSPVSNKQQKRCPHTETKALRVQQQRILTNTVQRRCCSNAICERLYKLWQNSHKSASNGGCF